MFNSHHTTALEFTSPTSASFGHYFCFSTQFMDEAICWSVWTNIDRNLCFRNHLCFFRKKKYECYTRSHLSQRCWKKQLTGSPKVKLRWTGNTQRRTSFACCWPNSRTAQNHFEWTERFFVLFFFFSGPQWWFSASNVWIATTGIFVADFFFLLFKNVQKGLLCNHATRLRSIWLLF